jgi:hypothetical protein
MSGRACSCSPACFGPGTCGGSAMLGACGVFLFLGLSISARTGFRSGSLRCLFRSLALLFLAACLLLLLFVWLLRHDGASQSQRTAYN